MNEILDCGHAPTPTECSPGYGQIMEENKQLKICFNCCAARDKEIMAKENKITLYLTHNCTKLNPFYEVTNWPGTLRFPVRHMRKGRHNIARVRYDVWFDGPGGNWHGIQYGDNTQVVHCKRVRK